MTEQALQQKLAETADFLQRQRLLKQLWNLQRQPNGSAKEPGRIQTRTARPPRRRAVSKQAEPVA